MSPTDRKSLFAVDRPNSDGLRSGYSGQPAGSQARSSDDLMRFIDAVSPFVRDVLDEPFPWKRGGQVVVTMTREEYSEAVAALEGLRD